MLQPPWEHKWCRPTKRSLFIHFKPTCIQTVKPHTYKSTSLLLESERLQLKLQLVNLSPGHKARAGACKLCINKAPRVGKKKTKKNFRVHDASMNGTWRPFSHPLFSIKEYLGTALVSGIEVATQLSTNTRRGTWLYGHTEASMLMKSPRKYWLEGLSNLQSSAKKAF